MLRQGARAGVITPEQHDGLMAMAPELPEESTGDARSPEALMVMAIYVDAGGPPISGGLMGTVDRRAEVMLPRLALAQRLYPDVDPEFFRGTFAYLDTAYAKRLREEQAAAADKR